MAVLDDLHVWRAHLDGMATTLGSHPGRLGAAETVKTLSFGVTLPPEALGSRLREETLATWFGGFGEALALDFAIPPQHGGSSGLRQRLDAREHSEAALAQIVRESTEYEVPVDVTATIRKEALGKRLHEALGAESGLRVIPFFFAASLLRVLAAPEMDSLAFERNFLTADEGPPDRRLLVLLADAGGQLQGPFLAVQGNDRPGAAEAFARAGAQKEELAATHATMLERTNWNRERPRVLTPDFFRLDQADGLAGDRAELLRLQNELALTYLANRTNVDEKGLTAFFEGERTVQVPVAAERRSDAPYRLYAWAYHDPQSTLTRLEIVRRLLANRLPSGREGFKTLIYKGTDLLSELDVQLRVLIDRNLTESFERCERIDKLVRDYADETRQRISGLARESIEDVYKTAGLLLGVVIAWLLEPGQRLAVLAVGSLLLSIYLLFVRFFYLPTLRREDAARREVFHNREEEIRGSGLLTKPAQQALDSVWKDNRVLMEQRQTVERVYLGFAILPLVIVLLWLAAGRLH